MFWNNPLFSPNPRPKPMSGYAFEFTGKSWKTSRNDDWDIVLVTPDVEPPYRWVGRRYVDDSEVNVWKTGDRYIAQTTVSTGR